MKTPCGMAFSLLHFLFPGRDFRAGPSRARWRKNGVLCPESGRNRTDSLPGVMPVFIFFEQLLVGGRVLVK